MSNLQPDPVALELNGETRHLLFDFGAIEKIQALYGAHPILAINSFFWDDKENGVSYYRAGAVIDVLKILLDTELSREKFFNGSTHLRTYTRDQIGHIIDRSNADTVVAAITQAWTGSMPEPDQEEEPDEEDEESKNLKSGRRK